MSSKKNSKSSSMDTLKQFVALREQLQKEKVQLEAKLIEINRVLSATEGSEDFVETFDKPEKLSPASPRVPRAPRSTGRAKRAPRAKNSISLREAVLQATEAKPLTAQEILETVKANGYKFTAKNPINSLRTLLYSDKSFKNTGGKFGPA